MSGDQAEDRAQGAHANELVGRVVGGKYRIERVLGRGGMGSIYVAEQQPLGRRVALKVLHSNLGGGGEDPEFSKRFLLEAATLSQLAHPNIVVVHDYGNLDDASASCFMVMELLEGRTINQVLNEEGVFEPARALRVTRDIARALRAAHALGVIHRDLKPANVMLCRGAEGETLKVLDFGLVKLLRDDSEELTAEGRFLGSPRYMSPEQIQRLPMDGRSDLYALGVILYRMLSGEVPFAGDNAVQTLMAHLSKPVPPMSTHGAQVPAVIDSIVMKLLEKDPEQRYRDADALIRAIDGVWPQLSPEPLLTSGEHPRPAGLTEDETPTSKSLPSIVMLAPPVTAAAAPAPAPPRARPRWLLPVIVLGGVLLGVGGAAIAAGIMDTETPAPPVVHEPAHPEPERSHEPRTDTPPEEPREPVHEEQTAPPPSATTFTLNVRSIPAGATLYRDGVEVGDTPIAIQLDRDALRDAPAHFTMHMHGRADVRFEQGPSDGDVTIERELPRVQRHHHESASDVDEHPRGGDLSIKTQR